MVKWWNGILYGRVPGGLAPLPRVSPGHCGLPTLASGTPRKRVAWGSRCVQKNTGGLHKLGDPQHGYSLIIYNPMKIDYLGPSLGNLHIIFGNPALFKISSNNIYKRTIFPSYVRYLWRYVLLISRNVDR